MKLYALMQENTEDLARIIVCIAQTLMFYIDHNRQPQTLENGKTLTEAKV
jgi:hypothetical protein